MRWIKLGKIFDPTDFSLPNHCREFAQAPQAVVFKDFVRIYFSTRSSSQTDGKVRSHIAYADFDRDLKTVVGVSAEPVIPLGGLGEFDEHGIFPINFVVERDRIIAYTCGWSRRVAVPVETSIGFAISDDNGKTFSKLGTGPIMTASVNEPFLVGDPFVVYDCGAYHMWYIFGTHWIETDSGQPERVYKIAYATSSDGLEWQRFGKAIIADRLNADECQALPSVLKIADRRHMYFCYREAIGFRRDRERSYRLGYAYSDDNRNWLRSDELSGIALSDSGWDSEMMCYPHLFEFEGSAYLLYNGNEFGRFGFGLARLESD